MLTLSLQLFNGGKSDVHEPFWVFCLSVKPWLLIDSSLGLQTKLLVLSLAVHERGISLPV